MCHVKMFTYQNQAQSISEFLAYIVISNCCSRIFFQYFINQRTGSIVTSRITANRHNDNFNTKLHPQLSGYTNGMNKEIYSVA